MESELLQGKLIYLCSLKKDFFPQYINAFSPCVMKILNVSCVDCEFEYLQTRLQKVFDGTTLFFCIFDKTTNKMIGAVEIREKSETSSQLYSWLNENYWGGGRYQEALRIATQIYFAKKNDLFFQAHVDIDNKRSYYALKKFGFADSGICNGSNCKQYKLVLRRR